MQDRLRFRFWHKPTEKMVNCYGFNPVFVFGDTLDGVGTEYNPANFKDCILMQCTGLKDKNGKLIYDGDLLKIKYLDSDKEDFAFELVKIGYDEKLCSYYQQGIDYDYKEAFPEFDFKEENFEIIGNIYENKELL